tara:strand:- start:12826 stop:13086 length:261 start_codon:yes stop_codon:yes gene_type:complete
MKERDNFEGLMILIGLLTAAALAFLIFTGCPHTRPRFKCNGDLLPPTADEIRTGNYDDEWVEQRADELGMRTVDYLHAVSSGSRRP